MEHVVIDVLHAKIRMVGNLLVKPMLKLIPNEYEAIKDVIRKISHPSQILKYCLLQETVGHGIKSTFRRTTIYLKGKKLGSLFTQF